MQKHPITKPQAVDYFKVPQRLWRVIEHLPPEAPPSPRGGRPRIGNRAVLNGLWYLMWTGAQWKAIKRDWFGVSSSVLHERFQTWQEPDWLSVYKTGNSTTSGSFSSSINRWIERRPRVNKLHFGCLQRSTRRRRCSQSTQIPRPRTR